MSKIEDLLEKLCPKGIEYQILGEVAEIKRGSTITKSETSEGEIPVIAGGQKPAYYHNESNREGETIAVAGSGAYAGFVSYWDTPVFVSDAFTVRPITNSLKTKFCFYFLKSLQTELHAMKSGGGVPHVYGKDVGKLRIPTPPVEIQEEIVRILDTFTELAAELEAELEARKSQFDLLRKKLIRSYSEDYSTLPLGSLITNLRTGLNPRQNFVLNPPGASCAYITVRELDGFRIRPTEKTDRVDEAGFRAIQNRSKLQIGDVLFSATGTIGRTALVEETPTNWGIKEGVYAISTDSTKLDPKFLIYIFGHPSISDAIITRSEGSTVKSISMASLKSLPIPLPPLTEQKRIVNILDVAYELTFESLPREIILRRKQYEYYRKKLLTFNELDVA